jgi:hypothetical protein
MKHCPKCGEEKEGTAFSRSRAEKDGLQRWCKACLSSAVREWRAADPGRAARSSRRSTWKSQGIPLDYLGYESLLHAQGGACAICGTRSPGAKSFSADHDHTTGQVRGLLCLKCNTGIGLLQDSPAILEAALEYLGGSHVQSA